MSSDMTPVDLDTGPDGLPVLEVCPADGCDRTDGLWLMECAPGYTWVFVNDCGHWGWIRRAAKEK